MSRINQYQAVERQMNDINNLVTRRPMVTLLSGPLCALSHTCRIVLHEKDIECLVDYVFADDDPAIIGEHNPYGETPTLLDRDITLYDTTVILEYLDERFPHPPLLPVDPINRAKSRLMIARLTRDWLKPTCALGDKLPLQPSAQLRQEMHDGLVSISPLFKNQPFFLGTEYTLVDAYLAAFIWRLPALGLTLPRQAVAVKEYGERLFQRPAFIKSLSRYESEIRDL